MRHYRTGLLPRVDVQAPKGACRTRLSACDRSPRRCVRLLVSSATFPLARSLPSTCSAGPMGRPLFAGFRGPLKQSDSLHPCTTVVPLGCTVRTWRGIARPDAGPPWFRTQCCCPCRGLRPRRVRLRLTLTASTMLPSACSERVGTRDKRRFRGSILCLDIPLSTLRAYRYRYTRMTRGQCGWLDLHCLGLAPFTTVPACPGADPNVALPPKAVFDEIIDVCYHASLLTEEGRPTVFRIVFLDSQGRVSPRDDDELPPVTRYLLKEPVPFTQGELRRLAPVADPRRVLIAVEQSGGRLQIYGLVDIGLAS